MIAMNPGKRRRQPRVTQLEAYGEEMSGRGPADFRKFRDGAVEGGGLMQVKNAGVFSTW
jgi:hypothetical protein